MVVRCLVVFTVFSASQAISAQNAPAALNGSTRVTLTLTQFISSETSAAGEAVRLVVADDVMSGRAVLIKRGTPAVGFIVEASPYRLSRSWIWPGSRAGRLGLSIDSTTTVDGQTIRLQPVRDQSVEPRVSVGQPWALVKWAHRGTRFDAVVDGEYTIHVSPP